MTPMVVLWELKLHIVDKIKTKEWARTEKGDQKGRRKMDNSRKKKAKMGKANSGNCDLMDSVTCEKGY